MSGGLTLVTGGVRSGKSRLAEALAAACGPRVAYVATLARSDDAEMARRIAAHAARRPAAWTTLEWDPSAMAGLPDLDVDAVLIDCLGNYATRAMLAVDPPTDAGVAEACTRAVDALLAALSGARAPVIVVSNEVGWGVVPATALGRWFRDELGLANQRLAAMADRVLLCVAGLPMALKGVLPPELSGPLPPP